MTFSRFTVAGPIVAYVEHYPNQYAATTTSGLIIRRSAKDSGSLGDSSAGIGRFVIDRAGRAAAVVDSSDTLGRTSQARVLLLDEHQRVTQADVGARDSFSGLTLTGGRVSWRHGGEPASTPLLVSRGKCAPPAARQGTPDTLDVLTASLGTEASAEGGTTQVCLRRTGATVEYPGPLGPIAGMRAFVDFGPRTDVDLQLVDLSTVQPVGPLFSPLNDIAVLLDPSGATVLLTQDGLEAVPLTLTVRAPDGSTRVLAQGALRAVSLDRGSVAWTQDGTQYRAPVTPPLA